MKETAPCQQIVGQRRAIGGERHAIAALADQCNCKSELTRSRAALNDAECHCCVMPMLNAEDSSGPVSGAVPCPAMPRRSVPERMTMAMPRSPNCCGLDVAGHARHRLLLLSATDTIRKGLVAAGNGTERCQAEIVGIRRLNFFALVDVARSGF